MEPEFKHKQSFKELFAKLKTGKRKRNKSMNLTGNQMVYRMGGRHAITQAGRDKNSG